MAYSHILHTRWRLIAFFLLQIYPIDFTRNAASNTATDVVTN